MDKPEWVLFLDSLGNEDGSLTEDGKEFYDRLNKLESEGKKCSCDCRIINGWGRCIQCHLMKRDDDFDFIWIDPHNERERWFCFTKELYNKLRKEYTITLVHNRGNYWKTLREYFYEKQKGICPECKKKKEIFEMDLHHKDAKKWGGIESENNLIMLCKLCHHKHITEALI